MPALFEAKWQIEAASDLAAEEGQVACEEAAADVLALSRPLVPIDTMRMWTTGAHGPDDAGTGAIIVYDTPYAVRQHEDTSLRHPNGGQAKFLEHPLLQDGPRLLLERLAEHLDKALR